jgi:hypothetical protein
MTLAAPLPEQEQLREAHRLVWEGDWPGAARRLLQAALLAEADARVVDAARCRQMASSLARSGGDLDGALASARALAATAADPAAVAFAAAAEKGETLLAADEPAIAITAYREAMRQADGLALPPAWRATVLRRLGEAQIRAGCSADGLATYAQACRLQVDTGDVLGAAFIAVEGAEAMVAAGAWPQVPVALERAQQAARAVDAPATLEARLALLRARQARMAGSIPLALQSVEQARDLALTGVDPLTYFAAVALLAELKDGQGDRVAAYRALATAWVTLADLLGRPIAASWVQPLLLAFQLRWGSAEFQRVKGLHDSQRRAEGNA